VCDGVRHFLARRVRRPYRRNVLYRWKFRVAKSRLGYAAWTRSIGRRRPTILDALREHAQGHSVVDIGCMWGVNGEYSFIAEEAGAASVKAVDVFPATPEFEAKRAERRSAVEFIHGDVLSPEVLDRVGVVDVVFCSGVLYHHPSPFEILDALHRICGQTLILGTATIPEINGLSQAAVYYPLLDDSDRKFWEVPRRSFQEGISNPFSREAGYSNWFWGMTPSCVAALLGTAGFRVDSTVTSPFGAFFLCAPTPTPAAG
jgi:2-polyprenyl-3-methyl-5-hydroxy-6-metoxy-1,4-benzoquinol methylase